MKISNIDLNNTCEKECIEATRNLTFAYQLEISAIKRRQILEERDKIQFFMIENYQTDIHMALYNG